MDITIASFRFLRVSTITPFWSRLYKSGSFILIIRLHILSSVSSLYIFHHRHPCMNFPLIQFITIVVLLSYMLLSLEFFYLISQICFNPVFVVLFQGTRFYKKIYLWLRWRRWSESRLLIVRSTNLCSQITYRFRLILSLKLVFSRVFLLQLIKTSFYSILLCFSIFLLTGIWCFASTIDLKVKSAKHQAPVSLVASQLILQRRHVNAAGLSRTTHVVVEKSRWRLEDRWTSEETIAA